MFGPEYYDSLAEWGPIHTIAVLVTEHLQKHEETFKMGLPPGTKDIPEDLRFLTARARWEMMVKVIDLKLQQISEFHRLLAQPNLEEVGQRALQGDGAGRYLTTAARELERALDWFRYVKERGL